MSCKREGELQESLRLGHWPSAAGLDLQEHVRTCARCSGVARLAEAFCEARTATMAGTPSISPGLLWWKAQLRRRRETLERVERPLLGARVFAFVVALVVGVALLIWSVGNSAVNMRALLPEASVNLGPMTVVACVAVISLLGGVAVWLGVEK